MNFGALFDWDGVVIDSSRQHEQSWELLAAELGKPLPPGHFVRGFGMRSRVIISEILRWASDADEIDRYSQRKGAIYREIIGQSGIEPLPGVRELLASLQEKGIACAVASSTQRINIETAFDAIGIRDYFQGVVASEDVAEGKPNPEVFLKGAELIGLPPQQCVVFEDALVGIEAGLAAGSKVVAVATTRTLEELGAADLAVHSLKDLAWRDIAGLFD